MKQNICTLSLRTKFSIKKMFLAGILILFNILIITTCRDKIDDSPPKYIVYIAGNYRYTENRIIPCYWKDGIRFDLDFPINAWDIYASAITVSRSNVYIAGSFIRESLAFVCYWKNGVRHDIELPTGAMNPQVSAIAVSDSNIYIVGNYRNSDFMIEAFFSKT